MPQERQINAELLNWARRVINRYYRDKPEVLEVVNTMSTKTGSLHEPRACVVELAECVSQLRGGQQRDNLAQAFSEDVDKILPEICDSKLEFYGKGPDPLNVLTVVGEVGSVINGDHRNKQGQPKGPARDTGDKTIRAEGVEEAIASVVAASVVVSAHTLLTGRKNTLGGDQPWESKLGMEM